MTKPRVEGFCDPEFSKLEEIFVKSVESGFDDGAGFALEVEGKEVLNPVSYTHLTLPTSTHV